MYFQTKIFYLTVLVILLVEYPDLDIFIVITVFFFCFGIVSVYFPDEFTVVDPLAPVPVILVVVE